MPEWDTRRTIASAAPSRDGRANPLVTRDRDAQDCRIPPNAEARPLAAAYRHCGEACYRSPDQAVARRGDFRGVMRPRASTRHTAAFAATSARTAQVPGDALGQSRVQRPYRSHDRLRILAARDPAFAVATLGVLADPGAE